MTAIELGKGNWKKRLSEFMKMTGPSLCNTILDTQQEFEPRLKSRMIDGVITTPELDDMHPFLDAQELASVRNSALTIDE